MGRYLQTWGEPLQNRIHVVAYKNLPSSDKLPDGTYIFADQERLSPKLLEAAISHWNTLEARGQKTRLANNPSKALSRYDMLKVLHQQGINGFNIHYLHEPWENIRFPVFVRHARQHKGAFTPLLNDVNELKAAIADLEKAGKKKEDLLIVEFIDTTDAEGFFRKYSATYINGRIIPHHVMFEQKWEVKGPGLNQPNMIEKEREFQQTNPHEDQLKTVFQLANIEYGRIDYAVMGDKVQVWEINTNPTLLYGPSAYNDEQRPSKAWFAEQLNKELMAMDDKSPANQPYIFRDRFIRSIAKRIGK